MPDKICSRCNLSKPEDDFPNLKSKGTKGQVYRFKGGVCKKCYHRARYIRTKLNPELWKKWSEKMRRRDKKKREMYPEKVKARQKAYEKRLKDQDLYKDTWLKAKYGISQIDYDNMFKAQEGSCVICKKAQTEFDKPFQVDHCHSTGRVRGLLCFRCNAGLGHFVDSVESLKSAISYLEQDIAMGL